MGIEDKYLDVLQNLEFAIVHEFRRDRTILDMNVEDAVAALAAYYDAEVQQRTPPQPRLSEQSKKLFDAVKQVCEWRLGRSTGPGHEEETQPLAPDEMVSCLRRIRKSVKLWTKEGGRQGYLNFVSQYIN